MSPPRTPDLQELGSLQTRRMKLGEAREVTVWSYPPPYDFYDMRDDFEGPEDLEAWLRGEGEEGRYSVFANGGLIGFFSFGADTRVSGGDYSGEALDIGLGLRPDLTGRGLGVSFVEVGLSFARSEFSPEWFRLSVARFNERAVEVYRRVGFEVSDRFIHRTSGGERPFLIMKRGA